MQGTLKEILETLKGWEYTLFINDMEIHRVVMSDDIYKVVSIEKNENNKSSFTDYRTDIIIKLSISEDSFNETYNLLQI